MHSLEEVLSEIRANSNLCIAVERDKSICYGETVAHKLCDKHYQRYKKYGTIDLPVKIKKKCKFIDCNEPHRAKGYCTAHYKKYIKSIHSCIINDCSNPVHARDYCKKHSDAFYRYGDPLGKSSYKPNINKELIIKNKKRFIHPRKNIKCVAPNCDKDFTTSVIRKGLCKNHYYKWHKYGHY